MNGLLTDRRVRESIRTCGACPEQYEGVLADGREFYFRYRSGWASLGIGPDRYAAAEAGLNHGDGLQGVFESTEEREAVLGRLLDEAGVR